MGIAPWPNGPGSVTVTDTGSPRYTHTHADSEQLFGGTQQETNLNFHTLSVAEAAWLPCEILYSVRQPKQPQMSSTKTVG